MRYHYTVFNKSKPKPAWLDRYAGRRRKYWQRLWDAQPAWADVDEIKAVYRRAALLRSMGFVVEVDHIVPLCGYDVSGLHIHTNLRVICKKRNAARGNHRWPGQPIKQHDLFEVTT